MFALIKEWLKIDFNSSYAPEALFLNANVIKHLIQM